MSYSLDINVLVYSVNTQAPLYDKAKQFLEACASSSELCVLSWETLYGFIRITTHPSIFKNPLDPERALENVRSLVSLPHVTCVSADEKSWNIFEKMRTSFKLRGNIVPDVVIASILEAHGVKKLYTNDRDFWKFPYLKPVNPFE